jgi:hypothetical protein
MAGWCHGASPVTADKPIALGCAGGRFRRTHCVPMPAVASVDELNALLEQLDDTDDRRRIGNRASSVGHDWAFERALLRPLPAEPFDTALTLTPRVDRYAQVMVRCCQYSVPARFIGHRVRVKVSASAVAVYDKNTVVARHQRAAGKGAKVLDLDHYLEILLRKPVSGVALLDEEHHERDHHFLDPFVALGAGLPSLLGSSWEPESAWPRSTIRSFWRCRFRHWISCRPGGSCSG